MLDHRGTARLIALVVLVPLAVYLPWVLIVAALTLWAGTRFRRA